MKRSPLLLLVLLLSIGVLACSSDSEPAQLEGGADAAACTDLQALSNAARKAAAIGSFSTRDDARRAAANLQSALADLRASAGQYTDLPLDELESAIDDFSASARTASSGIALGSSSGSLQTEATAIGSIRARISNTLNCP